MDVEIDIQFTLPADGKRAAEIKTSAAIIHSERLAQNVFHVGIQFKSLNINARRQLETFIEGLEQ
jgi:hypothetical protein